jgi:hypothetical protein
VKSSELLGWATVVIEGGPLIARDVGTALAAPRAKVIAQHPQALNRPQAMAREGTQTSDHDCRTLEDTPGMGVAHGAGRRRSLEWARTKGVPCFASLMTRRALEMARCSDGWPSGATKR